MYLNARREAAVNDKILFRRVPIEQVDDAFIFLGGKRWLEGTINHPRKSKAQ